MPTLLRACDLIVALPAATSILTPGGEPRQALLAATGWADADLDAVLADLRATDLADPRVLGRLYQCFAVANRLGVAPSRALGWTRAEQSPASAADVIAAVRSRFDEDRWPAVAATARNDLRERQRDACVSYLLQTHRLDSTDQLYARYLIDVEMTACQLTARIKQATAAVQLFVQERGAARRRRRGPYTTRVPPTSGPG